MSESFESASREKPAQPSTPANDDTLMWFGKHKGKPLHELPVGYLHWYYHECTRKDSCRLYDYIKRNLNALQRENPDLVWE